MIIWPLGNITIGSNHYLRPLEIMAPMTQIRPCLMWFQTEKLGMVKCSKLV